MANVFENSDISGIHLNNRILRSATHEGLADEEGNPTEELIKKYEALAKGGVGAIITGYAGVMQNGKCPFRMLMIDRDEQIPIYKNLTEHVHKLNTPIVLQIAHCGRQTDTRVTGLPTVAPSPIKDKLFNRSVPHELTNLEIQDVIEQFIQAAKRAQKSGFDGIQLHLAHGYLLSSFLSPHMNKRNDSWGGSTKNRFRIVEEIVTGIRKSMGSYPILVKMNGYERSKNGLKTEEAILIAKLLEECGCDAIEVSCGIAEEGFMTSRGEFPFDMAAKYNDHIKNVPKIILQAMRPILNHSYASPKPWSMYNLESAMKIKQNVNIPVIVVGGIRKKSEIEDIITNEKCDYVSMSRPFILEPGIVKKFEEEKQSEAKCLNCNYCMIGIEVKPLQCYYGKVK